MNCPPPSTLTDVEEILSKPTPAVVESLKKLNGDLLLVGVGGKMGPTLARMAKRAFQEAGLSHRVIGVSRFSSPGLRNQLEGWGIETIACDLFDEQAIQRLPRVPYVLGMLGFKFGTSESAARTWATNTYLPGLLSRQFRGSKIVAFSTGNVYPFVPVSHGGCSEDHPVNPVGEYGMSALGRERVFEFFSRQDSTPMTLIRLNYACELRYGVLVDIGQRVWREQPVPLAMGYFNVLWQADANAWTLQLFDECSSPPSVFNMTGPEILSVRAVAGEFGRLLNKEVRFVEQETPTALLSNSRRLLDRFGPPTVTANDLLNWISHWLRLGGETWDKPTHFEIRDGKF